MKDFNQCRGTVFAKERPFYYLQKSDVLKQNGSLRIGKLTVKSSIPGHPEADTVQDFFIVEDLLTSTRYDDESCALNHYEENLKIDEVFKRERDKH